MTGLRTILAMAPPEPAERAPLPAWLVDVLVAGVVTAIIVLGTIHVDAEASSDRPIDALAVVVGVVAGVALAGRRRWPWPVLVVVVAAAAIYTARSYPGGPTTWPGPSPCTARPSSARGPSPT